MKRRWLTVGLKVAAGVLIILLLSVPGFAYQSRTTEINQSLYASTELGSQAQSQPNGSDLAEVLAACSLLPEAREYLADDNGMVFYRIKIQNAGNSQFWMRMDLGPQARSELLEKRLDKVGPKDKLAD